MRFTVFTPTYNRKYIIENLYHSLQRQTFKDFEWLVVDDGSTDGTEESFRAIQQECTAFPIRYIKTENGGKHRAINIGVREASGELFFIVDSDDYLTDDALETADQVEKSIPNEEKDKFAGVCGQKGHDTNSAIGKTFIGKVLDITMLERPSYGIWGDKAEIFYTKVLKRYPFPEFNGEKFVTECVVWDRIAFDGLKLRFYNEIAVICKYLPDGLTSQGNDLLFKNPKGYSLYLYQCSKFEKIGGLGKWNQFADYFYKLRKEYSYIEICKDLHVAPLTFALRILGLRIIYRLYQ